MPLPLLLRWRLVEKLGPFAHLYHILPGSPPGDDVGGGGPGIVATILAAMATDYWLLPCPMEHFYIAAPNDVLALGIFTGTGFF